MKRLLALLLLIAGTCTTSVAEELTVDGVEPVVVKTVPAAGATDVDPALTEIRLTFSKVMKKGQFSLTTMANYPDNFPKHDGQINLLDDNRTWSLKVKLEPGRTYGLVANPGNVKDTAFTDEEGRRAMTYLLVFKTAGGTRIPTVAPEGRPAANNDDPVEAFRKQVVSALSKLTADKAGEQALRKQFAALVEQQAGKLRPKEGSKTYVSQDKMFVLVIAAHGTAGAQGGIAKAEHDTAAIVMAIAGDGSPSGDDHRAGVGGLAQAKAGAGIGIALGGNGGPGGGGGAGGSASGKIGSIGFGGQGGKGRLGAGGGGSATGNGIRNAEAIIEAIRALSEP